MKLEELVRSSQAARLRLTESHEHLRHRLDFPARAKESLLKNPGKWLGGILVAGFIGSYLFKSKNTPVKVRELKRQRGFLLGLLSLALAMGRPLAKVYATKLLRNYLATRFASGSRARFANLEKPPY